MSRVEGATKLYVTTWWRSLVIAFVAVTVESVADLMEPWPITVVV